MIVFPYLETGRADEALADIEARKKAGVNFWLLSTEGQVYARTNRIELAQRALEEAKKSAPKESTDPMAFVGAYVALKDDNRAISYLNEAVAKHSPGLTSLKVDPMFDPLRSDARFQAILSRVGLGR